MTIRSNDPGIGASITFISGDEREAFNKKLADCWEMAKEFWGKDAQSMFVTAFMSSDPLGFLADRLPRVTTY